MSYLSTYMRILTYIIAGIRRVLLSELIHCIDHFNYFWINFQSSFQSVCFFKNIFLKNTMLHYGIYCHELKLPISIKVKISLQKDFEDCKP